MQNVPRVSFRMVETDQSAPSAMLCCPIALDPMGPSLLMIVVRGKQLLGKVKVASVGFFAAEAQLRYFL